MLRCLFYFISYIFIAHIDSFSINTNNVRIFRFFGRENYKEKSNILSMLFEKVESKLDHFGHSPKLILAAGFDFFFLFAKINPRQI